MWGWVGVKLCSLRGYRGRGCGEKLSSLNGVFLRVFILECFMLRIILLIYENVLFEKMTDYEMF